MAVISALSYSSNTSRAHLFVNDFILTQLIDKDIHEIWSIKNPIGLLCEEFKKTDAKSLPKARLIWSTGSKTPTAVFLIGLYMEEKIISKGFGENKEIAEEMAARDALLRLYQIDESRASLPYGENAKLFSKNKNNLFKGFLKKIQ